MAGIELLKVALNEGVKVLPPNFLEDNNINSTYVGNVGIGGRGASVHVINEEPLNGTVVRQWL